MAASNLEEEHDGNMLVESGTARSLAQCQGRCSQSFIIVGASGDLAAKKTYPALFALFKRGLIPPHVIIAGYARSQMSDAAFKAKVSTAFPRLVTDADKAVQDAFLARCFYFAGPYDSSESWTCFASILTQKEASCLCKDHQRVFYLAVPPQQFVSVGKSIKACAMCPTSNRIVVEKPFGHDSASSDALSHELSSLFTEDETFRIDHYLGKEMIQNLMILRFANVVFEPLWNRKFIKCIRISFSEDFGVQGRGGYFDQYGILRDVMQNHLLQILSLVAMEPPVSLHAEDVRDEKVKLLRAIRPITINNVVLGQYTAAAEKEVNGVKVKGECGYIENTDVPDDSTTPTYALAVLFVQNERWNGTPFIMSCGKALNEKQVEIRVQFHPPGNALFPELAVNELVVCIQPHEGMYMKMNSKVPGLAGGITQTYRDFTLPKTVDSPLPKIFNSSAQTPKKVSESPAPTAYERLLYDVTRNDHNLFVRKDELREAWKIFTPLLHELESKETRHLHQPHQYPFGSGGPEAAKTLAQKYGYRIPVHKISGLNNNNASSDTASNTSASSSLASTTMSLKNPFFNQPAKL